MINLSEFNKIYNSDEAVALRKEIADLNYNIQYLQIRASHLNSEMSEKISEYNKLLGVGEDGKDEKK